MKLRSIISLILVVACIVSIAACHVPGTVCTPTTSDVVTESTTGIPEVSPDSSDATITPEDTPAPDTTMMPETSAPETPPHMCEFAHYQEIQEATCTSPGLGRNTCECGATEDVVIPALGHVFGNWTTDVASTCTENGLQYRVCENCIYTETNVLHATGHKMSTPYESQPLTCTQNGIVTTKCEQCDYYEETVTEAQGHKYGEYKTTKSATCTKDGTKERKCLNCSDAQTASIGKLGHKYSNGVCTRCNAEDASYFPKHYEDDGVSITINKITYGKTVCYVAEVQLTDYARFFTACGKNKYGGQSSTSAAAKLQNAVFAVNGCYSAPYLNYQVARRGVIYNGGERNCGTPGVYSSVTGLFGTPKMLGVNKMSLNDAVAQGLVTDTFCFGPESLVDGVNHAKKDSNRAQRTFIGTNGTPGHLVIGVSNGRYSDGISPGLTGWEINEVLLQYGCTYGIALDGGGSSTMVFKGQILNQLANNTERNWIVDFCCISNP